MLKNDFSDILAKNMLEKIASEENRMLFGDQSDQSESDDEYGDESDGPMSGVRSRDHGDDDSDCDPCVLRESDFNDLEDQGSWKGYTYNINFKIDSEDEDDIIYDDESHGEEVNEKMAGTFNSLEELIDEVKHSHDKGWVGWSDPNGPTHRSWIISDTESGTKDSYESSRRKEYSLHITRVDGKKLSRKEISFISKKLLGQDMDMNMSLDTATASLLSASATLDSIGLFKAATLTLKLAKFVNDSKKKLKEKDSAKNKKNLKNLKKDKEDKKNDFKKSKKVEKSQKLEKEKVKKKASLHKNNFKSLASSSDLSKTTVDGVDAVESDGVKIIALDELKKTVSDSDYTNWLSENDAVEFKGGSGGMGPSSLLMKLMDFTEEMGDAVSFAKEHNAKVVVMDMSKFAGAKFSNRK